MVIFKRILNLLELKKALQTKLETLGTPKEAARAAVHDMNEADEQQMLKDLLRIKKGIEVVNEVKGKTKIYDSKRFSNKFLLDDFMLAITQDDSVVKGYLEQYMHQGGFLYAAEFLLSYYFLTVTEDSGRIRFEFENRRNKFVLQKDGSLLYEESFNISEIKSGQEVKGYKPDEGPIASVTMRSKISVKDGKLSHDFEDIEIKAHHEASKKLFRDPRSPFVRFKAWVKDKVNALFNKAANDYQKKLKTVKKAPKRL